MIALALLAGTSVLSLFLHVTADAPSSVQHASTASAVAPLDPEDDGDSGEGQEEDDCGWVDMGCHTK
ncbi:hypothetical protein [Actinomadura sp. GTD37]|uniref:hypothetical protein n=1 Tax=Actinomadura sp. GTD37 TaxID=1778030 RepID=UPI0035C01610